MADKIKAIIAAGLTFGVLSIPGFGDWINAAGGQAEIVAAVVAVYTIVHGVVHYAHGKVVWMSNRLTIMAAVLLGLFLGLPVPVSVGAQGGDAVYRSLRLQIPLAREYMEPQGLQDAATDLLTADMSAPCRAPTRPSCLAR